MKRLTRSNRAALVAALLLVVMTATAACRREARDESAAVATSSRSASRPGCASNERIVSLSPSTTEVLYGVGMFPCVVAVSDYDKFPAETAQLPHVGGWSNTNLEQVTQLRPTLVVMADAQAPFVKDKLDTLGLRTVVVPSRSVEDALAGIEQLGRALHREAEANQLLEATRAALEDVRSRTRDLPHPRVLCVVDRVPGTLRGLYTAAPGSFIAQLLEVAGAESIAPPAANGYGQISKEAVVTLNPDVIIDMVQGDAGNRLAEDPKEVWRELAQVKAVRDGRIYPLRDTSVLHPSQFVADTARQFARLLHPDVFGTP